MHNGISKGARFELLMDEVESRIANGNGNVPVPELWLPPAVQSQLVQKALGDLRGQVVRLPNGEQVAVVQADEELVKSLSGGQAQAQPYRGTPGLLEMGAAPGIVNPPARERITWEALRTVPQRNPVFAAIEQRFLNILARFSRPNPEKQQVGFEIGLRDPKQNMTSAAQKKATWIQQLLWHGGLVREHPRTGEPAVWSADFTEAADDFPTFLRKVFTDRLRFDHAAIRFEVGENEKKYPIVFFKSVDGARVRRARPQQPGKDEVKAPFFFRQGGYIPTIRPELKHVKYVLVLPTTENQVEREFQWDELTVLVQNPSNDPTRSEIGYPENEMCLDLITGILYGMETNLEKFDSNHIPRGFLVVKMRQIREGMSGAEDTRIASFRKYLRLSVGGMGQLWALPIISVDPNLGEDVPEYIKMDEDPSAGMYWKEWMIFCASVAAAVHGLQAGELNFAHFGQSSNALSSDSLEERIEYSASTGVVPKMQWLGQKLDTASVARIDPDFCFRFVNLEPRSEEAEQKADAHFLSNGIKSVAEIRTEKDLSPVRDPLDRDLWRQVCKQREESEAKLKEEDEDAWWEMVANTYEESGGEFAQWPTAPQGPLLQVWMAEHGIGGMGGPVGPEGPGGEPGEEEEEEAPPQAAQGEEEGRKEA
ncbi:MAG: hypothetical protein UY48_C0002G0030 [Candidatus Gottesmanbacteria bacterium GW2011_GWB1_49_7]|uniref:Portal protein n=1 Tax=Candidatus Gottesmanbacteria bacterium GW2011_GWB1_49_7 TaxID=1618448 RepID=A0A0G1Z3H1_9BACT|nr:MAG: hypothetical protein UY48_C0002G0030 [Candidatus Gottesmanbacteria bacterium GW2011_GWB1_49_7]